MITTIDPLSKLPVNRLTDGWALWGAVYFTKDGTFADGRRLTVLRTDADGHTICIIDLADGRIHELLRLGTDPDQPVNWSLACVDNQRGILYGYDGQIIFRLDLHSGERGDIHRVPAGWNSHGISLDADGTTLRTAMTEEFTARFGERGFDVGTERRILAGKPLSQVYTIGTDGSGLTTEFEEQAYITHVECSPTIPGLFTFCHEGPWLEIDQRIWGLRAGEGRPWAIIPKDPSWGVGHEFWCADGEHIGYHARYCEGEWRHAAGYVKYDNTDHFQAELAAPTQHAHAQTTDAMILDGTRRVGNYLMIVQRDGDSWRTPKIICRHDTSRHHGSAHVHAHLQPDQRTIIYTSDRRNGLCDIYTVTLPEKLDDLPDYDEPPFRYYWM